MDRALDGQRRYLAARRAAAAAAPDLCANQLAALTREAALADGATSAGGYRRRSADLFELTRGEWLDRVVGHARIAAAVDDPWAVAALRGELAATLAARDPVSLGEQLRAAAVAAAATRGRGGEATTTYTRLLAAVVRCRSEGRDLERGAAIAEAEAAARRLLAIDASFDVHALGARYRWRTPWTGRGFAALAGWIDEVGISVDARATPPDGAAELAAIEAAAAAWRARLPTIGGAADLHDDEPVRSEVDDLSIAAVVAPYRGLAALAGDSPELGAIRAAAAAMVAVAATESTPQDVLAAWVERGALVALARAPIEAGLIAREQRLRRWPEPLLAHHLRALRARLAAATSPTEVDLVSVHADACLGVEADWNQALAIGLLAPLRATFIAGWDDGDGARRGVAASWRAVHQLIGAGPDLVAWPWVAAFLDEIVVEHAGRGPAAFGAELGEAGADVVGEARAAIAVARGDGELEPLEPLGLRAWLRGRWGTPPPAVPGQLQLWDQPLAVASLGPALPAPARPPLPGRIDGDGS